MSRVRSAREEAPVAKDQPSAVGDEQPAADTAARVVVRRGRARPLWFGHPWVYGNAVARTEGEAQPGDVVSVTDFDGRFIGRGIWNPRSQIVVRLCTRNDESVDGAFLAGKLRAAIERRRRLGFPSAETTAYRLVNSEGDDLPGLVVDVYGSAVCVQVSTLGMARRQETLFDALTELLRPTSLFEVAAASYAEIEGFSARSGLVRGQGAETVACREDGIELEVEPLGGQKTGMFLDQRENRRRVGALARGARVLDCYAYAGGFSLQAARGGAREVTAVDSSARAVARVLAHAQRNQVQIQAVESDVFRFLETATPVSYDLVVVDPPKFARARKDLDAARKGYERLNALAFKAAAPGAIVLTCSCSQNVDETDFERTVAAGAKQAGRTVRVLDVTGPGPDHPRPPGFAEGSYLKAILASVD